MAGLARIGLFDPASASWWGHELGAKVPVGFGDPDGMRLGYGVGGESGG